MSDFLSSHGTSTYISQRILIVPFQSDFYKEVIDALRESILFQIKQFPDLIGLIIDISKLTVVDLENMKVLEDFLKMASVMGVEGYLTGVRPEVTRTLIDLDYKQGQLNTALDIDNAIKAIREKHSD